MAMHFEKLHTLEKKIPSVLDLETNSMHLSRHTCPMSIKLCKQSPLTKGIQVTKCIYMYIDLLSVISCSTEH